MSVTTTGDEDLTRSLHGISDGLAHLDDPATTAGRLLVDDAQRRAPRLTGRLRASIAAAKDGKGVTVGTTIAYGWPIHQGVPAHNIAAHPFLMDALRAHTDDIVTGYSEALVALVAKEV